MIYVFIADGFEEAEALVPVDIMRRAELEVVTVGIGSCIIKGSHGIRVMTDTDEKQITMDENVDMIVLPGGMPGTLNLEKNETVQSAIDYCIANDKLIGAICAAPSILGRRNLLEGKKATCFPGFEQFLLGAEYTGGSVVRDGKIITAKGAGVATKFGLALVEAITNNKARANRLAQALQCDE